MQLSHNINKYLNKKAEYIKFRLEQKLQKRNDGFLYKTCLGYINKYLNLPFSHNQFSTTVKENCDLNKNEIASKAIHINSLPSEVEIGTTKVCNITPPCVQCPKHVLPEFGYVNNDAFHMKKSYIDRMAPYIKSSKFISLHGYGEPLTCPYLFDSLEYCTDDSYTFFCTNGVLLNDSIIKNFLDKKISNITVNISLDAATHETYLKIRHHDFDKTLQNIKNLIKARDERNLKSPSIAINMTLMRENIAEFPAFIKLAEELNADVHIYRLGHGLDYKYEWFDYKSQHCENDQETHDFYIQEGYELAEKLGVKIFQTGKKFLNKNDTDFLFLSKEIPKDKFFCELPWSHVFINTDGSVYNCCWQSQPIGHLEESSFWKIWNGELIKSIRQATANGIPHKICSNGDSSCPFVQSYLSSKSKEAEPVVN